MSEVRELIGTELDTSTLTGGIAGNASVGSCRAARCAVCDGKFGLVRHYSWRTPLCSKKCVERLRTRRQNDRNWMGWLQINLRRVSESSARAS
jgi:hypothetical protein